MKPNIFTPELVVSLPYLCDSKAMQLLIASILSDDLEPCANRVIFDFAQLRFVDPSAITMFSNVIEYLTKKKNVTVTFRHYSFPTDGNKYLDDSGFFEKYIGRTIFPGCALRKTTLPLQVVKHDYSLQWMNFTFSDWISERVGLSKDSIGSVIVCLQEIFNNIIDHSGEDVACVFAQHYPAKNEVMLSISDFGVGIPTNVRKVKPEMSDSAAIAQAVIEGFTTKSNVRNQGAGLNVLTRYIVNKNKGRVLVRSLKGSFESISAASGPRHIPGKEKVSYPGTLIQIIFRTDTLESVSKKEEFEW